MSDDSRTAIDSALAKTAVRWVAVGLAAFALLPPLLWAVAVVAVQHHLAAEAPAAGLSGPDRLTLFSPSSTALIALGSAALAFALWSLVLYRPMRALRQSERQLRVTAKRDALTGLPNREGLRFSLERAIARCRGTPRSVGVLVVDLDRFRLVNHTFGPAAGDQILRATADRIRSVVRDSDIVARLGSDQFAIQLDGIPGEPALTIVAQNLLRAFEPALAVHGHEVVATLSIGMALAEGDADHADALLERAQISMRAAKAQGGACYRKFDAATRPDDQKRLELESHLRRALRDSEFELFYQPIMDASGARIVAVEALLRWKDPQRGMVSPAQFIPVLEQTGLIVGVGAWVLREACRTARAWIAGGARSLVVSVNVSPRQFAEPGFLKSVQDTLAETRFPAGHLQLEVTEGLLLEPTPETMQKIHALVGSGVLLAIDDFGIGYSSLAYLKTFPLHTMKIDRLFVNEIAKHSRDAAIVRAIIELGHGLGLRITAEGVETAAQFEALRKLGCDCLQGYLFGKPVPSAQMQALLGANRAKQAASADALPAESASGDWPAAPEQGSASKMLSLPPEVHARARAAAEVNGMSFNQWAAKALDQAAGAN